MAKYISLLRFTEAGAKGIKNSTERAKAFCKAAEKLGVRVEAQYWTSGPYDGLLILSANDEQKILRSLAELASTGDVRTETMRAFDAQELDAIIGKP